MTATIDAAKAEAFAEKVLTDVAGANACYLGAIGDALGLFSDLAKHGPATSAELAGRAHIDERYAREWLAGMHAAGYVERDTSGRYVLPAEHVPVLAEEGGASFLAPAFRDLVERGLTFDALASACRHGGGIPVRDFPDVTRETLARITAPWFENALVQEWIPLMPAVADRMQRGGRVADVGCGRGLAVIRMAQAFPTAQFVGYDQYEPDLAFAARAAHDARVSDRVTFTALDAARGLPDTFEVVTTFDVLHDAADPAAILRSIHAALTDDGRYVCVDINCQEKPEDNVGPFATIKYGYSFGQCLTVSLAEGGAGLGTCGLAEPVLRRLAHGAGFTDMRTVPVDDPFNCVYELKP